MRPLALIAAFLLLGATPQAEAHYRQENGHLLNDLSVTPGGAVDSADSAVICVSGYTSKPGVRHVTAATKAKAYELYGATKSGHPPHAPSCCEVDHLISLELGGSNDIRNLWPEPYPDASDKDKVENALHWLVCHGRLNLKAAQHGIATDWVAFRDSLVAAGNWTDGPAQNIR